LKNLEGDYRHFTRVTARHDIDSILAFNHTFVVQILVTVNIFVLSHSSSDYTGWAKKRGHRLMTIILSNLNRFTNFFAGKFLGKFAIKCILKILPYLAYVATLLCETLVSAKQAINDKLQGNLAAYLRSGGVVNNQINKGLLLSLWVKKFKIGEYLEKVTSKNVIVSCTFFVF